MPVRLPEFTLESASPEDARALAAMHAESFKAAYASGSNRVFDANVTRDAAAFIQPERILRRAKMIRDAQNGDTAFYHVASELGRDFTPVGFIYGRKSRDGQELAALYVDPDHLGRGIGRALTERFLEWTDSTQAVEVGVAKINKRAQGFYQAMGFRATGLDRVSYYPYLPETTMIKDPQGAEHEV